MVVHTVRYVSSTARQSWPSLVKKKKTVINQLDEATVIKLATRDGTKRRRRRKVFARMMTVFSNDENYVCKWLNSFVKLQQQIYWHCLLFQGLPLTEQSLTHYRIHQ